MPTAPGGAREDRTPDLLHAMQALSQLSYGPADHGTGREDDDATGAWRCRCPTTRRRLQSTEYGDCLRATGCRTMLVSGAAAIGSLRLRQWHVSREASCLTLAIAISLRELHRRLCRQRNASCHALKRSSVRWLS